MTTGAGPMILYQFPGGDRVGSISAPCLKVEMALRLAGADYRTRALVNRREVRRISPTGRLPVLEIDGERIADSIVIVDRLEALFPEAGLSPADPAGRIHDRLWEHYATDSLYWTGYVLRWVRPDTSATFLDALFGRASAPVRVIGRPLVARTQRRRALAHGSGARPAAAIDAETERGLDLVEGDLAGGPFLRGRARPGRGDLAVASLLVQAGWRGTLAELRDRILARPAIVAHLRAVLDACDMDRPRWIDEAPGG